MRFKYVSAWQLVGGISLRQDQSFVEILSTPNSRFTLTAEPDSYLFQLDRGIVVANQMLDGFLGKSNEQGTSSRLLEKVHQLQAERLKKINKSTILIFEAADEIEASISEPTRKFADFAVTFDAVDKNAIKGRYSGLIQTMKLALSLESQRPIGFLLVTSGVYLQDSENNIIYSYTFSGSAKASVSSGLKDEDPAKIASRFTKLAADKNLKTALRLFEQLTDDANEPLKTFINGWIAIEILTHKIFEVYKTAFWDPLLTGKRKDLRAEFLERLQSVMNDKYRLTDKALIISIMLFEDDPEKDIVSRFRNLKILRDKIFHGEDFDEKALPISELQDLLKTLLLAYSNRLTLPDADIAKS